MKKVPLSNQTINKIVESSTNAAECLLALYKEVIKEDWNNIESFDGWPKCHDNTAVYILDSMHTKFDHWSVTSLWLNKGFASDKSIKENMVVLPDDLYILKGAQSAFQQDIIDMTASYAKVEVEELGEDPNDFLNEIP